MNPSEKHILEIDSVELSFGDRRILSGVYCTSPLKRAALRRCSAATGAARAA